VDAIIGDDEKRVRFLKSMLRKLGIEAAETNMPPLRLSRVHLTAANPSDVASLVDRLQDIITTEGNVTKIVNENDTFILGKDSSDESCSFCSPESDIVDYNEVPKLLLAHDSRLPSNEETPFFDHKSFYENLSTRRHRSRSLPSQFGTFMLYGETVTSTNTMLDKSVLLLLLLLCHCLTPARNPKLLQQLPNGLTFTATTQVAGRGRGNNVWISPKGCMIFSTVIRHTQELNITAPVVFIQYLVGLAVVEGIRNYAPGYERMPVRLKWPNDICLSPPTRALLAPSS